LKKLVKQGLGLIVKISKFRYVHTNFKKLIRGKRHWDYIFCGILDPAAVQDCTKIPGLNRKRTPTIIERYHQRSSVCYQRYEKRLQQQKGRQNVDVCASEENWKRNYN